MTASPLHVCNVSDTVVVLRGERNVFSFVSVECYMMSFVGYPPETAFIPFLSFKEWSFSTVVYLSL